MKFKFRSLEPRIAFDGATFAFTLACFDLASAVLPKKDTSVNHSQDNYQNPIEEQYSLNLINQAQKETATSEAYAEQGYFLTLNENEEEEDTLTLQAYREQKHSFLLQNQDEDTSTLIPEKKEPIRAHNNTRDKSSTFINLKIWQAKISKSHRTEQRLLTFIDPRSVQTRYSKDADPKQKLSTKIQQKEYQTTASKHLEEKQRLLTLIDPRSVQTRYSNETDPKQKISTKIQQKEYQTTASKHLEEKQRLLTLIDPRSVQTRYSKDADPKQKLSTKIQQKEYQTTASKHLDLKKKKDSFLDLDALSKDFRKNYNIEGVKRWMDIRPNTQNHPKLPFSDKSTISEQDNKNTRHYLLEPRVEFTEKVFNQLKEKRLEKIKKFEDYSFKTINSEKPIKIVHGDPKEFTLFLTREDLLEKEPNEYLTSKIDIKKGEDKEYYIQSKMIFSKNHFLSSFFKTPINIFLITDFNIVNFDTTDLDRIDFSRMDLYKEEFNLKEWSSIEWEKKNIIDYVLADAQTSIFRYVTELEPIEAEVYQIEAIEEATFIINTRWAERQFNKLTYSTIFSLPVCKVLQPNFLGASVAYTLVPRFFYQSNSKFLAIYIDITDINYMHTPYLSSK